MGRFSTTVHIKSSIDKSKFKDLFCGVMKKRGFVPCSEDEAALSYLLAFSEGGWITLSSDMYSDNPGQAHDDVRQIAEEMKTSGFSVEVVDSDFAILKLFGGDNSDEVIVGDGSGYGIENGSKGSNNCWEPLLSENKTWEQLSEIWGSDEVFVEDTLWKAAPILGIEPKYISADYSELSTNAESDKNIVSIYFKRETDDKNDKPLSFDEVFINIFGKALEPIGIKKSKSKHPFFVRVMPGGEIVHIITYCKVKTYIIIEEDEPLSAYEIVGGVAAIYRSKINVSKAPTGTGPLGSFSSNCEIYTESHRYDLDMKYRASIMEFFCNKNKEANMEKSLSHALEVTEKHLLQELNKVDNLETCIEYLYKFHPFVLSVPDDLDKVFNTFNFGEFLAYFAVKDYHNTINREIEEAIEKLKYEVQNGLRVLEPDEFDETCQAIKRNIGYISEKLDAIVNDNQMYDRTMIEFSKRKENNNKTLKKYGLL